MEESTPEARGLAGSVLKALLEWHPGILEPAWCRVPRPKYEQDLQHGFLARRLEWFLTEGPLSSVLGWELLLHWADPPANV